MFTMIYRFHAVRRMLERNVSEEDVSRILKDGKTIESYPNDRPYPSRLVMGYANGRPLHVVLADNIETRESIIITVYEPNTASWETDFEKRKKK